MTHRIGIIGAGLIGNKRAATIADAPGVELAVTVDINRESAEKLAGEFGGEVETDWEKVVTRSDVDIFIIATVNNLLAPVAVSAMENGKHVLCEKPLGRNVVESEKIVATAKKHGVTLKTGFNHRYHPAIFRAMELFRLGKIGELMFIRCRYGHGGRPGYDKEWRADKELCGGGELLDQGVHIVDLFRWFAGEFSSAFGFTPTFFWNMQVEDNAFALFQTDKGVVASMHTSWTQWKNIFSFELFGSSGYLAIEGLGGSYGVETLKIGMRKPEGGVPLQETVEFPGQDISWQEELKDFLTAINENREPLGNGNDGLMANRMLSAVYRSAKSGQAARL